MLARPPARSLGRSRWRRAAAFMPFTKGHRDCMGRNLALIELRLMTIAFFR